MNTFFRRFLLDSRRFRLAMILLGLLLTLGSGLIVGLAILTQTIRDQYEQGTMSNQGCDKIQELADEANVPFRQHADLLNGLDGNLSDPAVRRARMDSLAHLPGAIGALCLTLDQTLETVPPQAGWDWVTDSLKVVRRQFHGVRDQACRTWIVRALFRTFTRGRDSLCLAADIYSPDGKRIPRKASAGKPDPEKGSYLFAVVMDPHWIHEAVRAHMEEALTEKDAFILWTTTPERYGFGVLAGGNYGWDKPGDTLWWWGLRSVSGKNRHSHVADWDWHSNSWFRCRFLYDEEDRVWTENPQLTMSAKVILGAAPLWVRSAPYTVCLLLLGSGALFMVGLTQMRRQWLARQIALEHLSHSIKTPVARLRLSTDTLQEGRFTSPEIERDVVQSIGRECGRLERAVQNAALAIQEGGLKTKPSLMDLADLLSELKATWQAAFTQQRVGLDLNLETRGTGHYDRDLLAVLLDNLLDNALRHSRLNQSVHQSGKARVTVRLITTGNSNVIRVCDSGSGVEGKDAKRIFRRFERGRDRALSGVSGLGLGLALSKEIVEAHGGSIAAENNPDGGACFTVTLPCKERETISA